VSRTAGADARNQRGDPSESQTHRDHVAAQRLGILQRAILGQQQCVSNDITYEPAT